MSSASVLFSSIIGARISFQIGFQIPWVLEQFLPLVRSIVGKQWKGARRSCGITLSRHLPSKVCEGHLEFDSQGGRRIPL